jgi:branched-subunit amino acid ABC-type transport system permease component
VGEVGTYLIPALDGVAYGLLLSVLAAGLSLCWGTGNVLNLAHGTLYLLGAYATAMLSSGSWLSFLASILVGAACGGLGGGVLAVATRPVHDRGPLPQALLTFGIALVAGDLLSDVFGTDERAVTVPSALNGVVSVAGHRYPTYRLAFIGLAAVVSTACYLVLQTSRTGAMARAAVDDAPVLATLGVNPRAVHTLVIVAAGALAGLGGALGAPIIGPGPGTDDTVLLLCLVVVVLGRLGSIVGAVLASIAVGEIENLGPVLAPSVTPYLLFGAVALVLAVRRTSLIGGVRT